MKTGDYVWITCQGRTIKGIITLASPNGKSLALAFDAMLSGHVGMMPVFLDDDGVLPFDSRWRGSATGEGQWARLT